MAGAGVVFIPATPGWAGGGEIGTELRIPPKPRPLMVTPHPDTPETKFGMNRVVTGNDSVMKNNGGEPVDPSKSPDSA